MADLYDNEIPTGAYHSPNIAMGFACEVDPYSVCWGGSIALGTDGTESIENRRKRERDEREFRITKQRELDALKILHSKCGIKGCTEPTQKASIARFTFCGECNKPLCTAHISLPRDDEPGSWRLLCTECRVIFLASIPKCLGCGGYSVGPCNICEYKYCIDCMIDEAPDSGFGVCNTCDAEYEKLRKRMKEQMVDKILRFASNI